MVNYIFDPEEKEYITVTRPYPYSVGCHGKPLFPAEIYRRRAKLKVNLIPETKERGGTTSMTDRDRMIDDIILAFDWEMGCIEKDNVWFESVQGNTPSLTDAYNRVHRKGKKYDEQRAALRRVLRRILPTDTTPPDTKTMEKQLRPAAKEAVEKALAEAVKDLNK